eukprot:scaffold25411_cov33-Tisochrysis_lutea.AAC.1
MAAAIAARSVALRHAKAKQEEIKRVMEMLRAQDDAEVTRVFEQIDTAGRTARYELDRDQARVLIQLVVGESSVDEDGFEMIFPEKTKGGGQAGEVHATLQDMIHAVQNYRVYLAQRDDINELFHKHDLDQNMKLGREELRQAILESEAALRLRAVSSGLGYEVPERDRREVLGFTLHLQPTSEDLDRIFQECDRNGDGGLSKSEILPALELWSIIAADRVKKGQPRCILS